MGPSQEGALEMRRSDLKLASAAMVDDTCTRGLACCHPDPELPPPLAVCRSNAVGRLDVKRAATTTPGYDSGRQAVRNLIVDARPPAYRQSAGVLTTGSPVASGGAAVGRTMGVAGGIDWRLPAGRRTGNHGFRRGPEESGASRLTAAGGLAAVAGLAEPG